MSKSHRSSHASEICRHEWRPSRWLAAALMLLGFLGAAAVLASEMPRESAWLLAVAALIHGAWLATREYRKPRRAIVWNGHADTVSIDGVAVADADLHWRSALAFLSWKDQSGRTQRLCFWPDALARSARRELRLAAGPHAATRAPGSMAP